MKGTPSKRRALKVDVTGPEIYCLHARACVIQPGNFTGYVSEGVKTFFLFFLNFFLRLWKKSSCDMHEEAGGWPRNRGNTQGSCLALEIHSTITTTQPESPTVTLTWHACKYKVHKLHQRYILRSNRKTWSCKRWGGISGGALGMYLWWSLCTLYLHACQVRVAEGNSGLCCICVTYFER